MYNVFDLTTSNHSLRNGFIWRWISFSTNFGTEYRTIIGRWLFSVALRLRYDVIFIKQKESGFTTNEARLQNP